MLVCVCVCVCVFSHAPFVYLYDCSLCDAGGSSGYGGGFGINGSRVQIQQ